MKLLVVSPESEDVRELPALPRLFAAGLAHYHVRKPAWDRARLAALLRAVPAEFHGRLVLHNHHDLASEFAVAGLHERDSQDGARPPRMSSTPPTQSGAPNGRALPAIFTSRACHDLHTLRAALGQVSRVLLSPVFPSISKPGHNPDHRLPRTAIAAVLAQRTSPERHTEVIALGGIDAARLADCRALGFDGAAALGAIWQSPDPVAAFVELLAHAR